MFPHGYDATTKALIDRYPEDEKGIKRFMKLIACIRKKGLKLPRTPLNYKLTYPFMTLLYSNSVEASRHTVESWLDKYITNENGKLDLVVHIAYLSLWTNPQYRLVNES